MYHMVVYIVYRVYMVLMNSSKMPKHKSRAVFMILPLGDGLCGFFKLGTVCIIDESRTVTWWLLAIALLTSYKVFFVQALN